MKKLISIIIITAIAACTESGSGQTCSIDLDALCGERPSTDAYYNASGKLGTPELTAADIEAIHFYGDRLTAWASCAASLTTELE